MPNLLKLWEGFSILVTQQELLGCIWGFLAKTNAQSKFRDLITLLTRRCSLLGVKSKPYFACMRVILYGRKS